MSLCSNFQASTVMASSTTTNSQATLSTAVDMEPVRFSAIDPSSITKLVKTGDQKWLRDHGSVEGIVSALETDGETGIHGGREDITSRRITFGSNMYREYKPAKALYRFMLEALKDPMILILLVCAVLSIGFGIKKHGLRQGWFEGVTKLGAILIAVAVSAGSNFWPDRQCHRLSEASSYIPQVDVIRSSQWQRMSIPRIVVGDVVFLKPGDQVPADGLFLSGCSLQVAKLKADGQFYRVEVDGRDNPFLVSGTNVVDGYARMVVTAVRKNRKGHMIQLNGTLLNQFEELTAVVGKAGYTVAFIVLLILLARFSAGNMKSDEKGSSIVDALVAVVGVVATPAMIAVTSTPDGLLLAVKIALAYSMKRMKDNWVLLRKPSLCHAIGSVTTICTNKTGSLTVDSKEVNKFWLGLSSIEEVPPNLIAPNVLELLHQAIGLNTSQPPSRSLFTSPANSTEKAIFDWAVRQMGMDIQALKGSCTILEIEPFNPENKQSGVLISNNTDNTIHVHRKGAPDIIIPMCSHYYETTGIVKVMNKSAKVLLDQIFEDMAENGLRCIAFAHRRTSIRDYFTFSRQQLILLGLVGLTNNRRIGIKKAVEDCQCAGVNFKMITGDNMFTARAVAAECGIIEIDNIQSGEVVEAMEFRNYTPEERIEKAENIRVMARATPLDKFLMVQCLKKKGHVVAVVGRGIGDVQALREADIGICFGTQGADIAKACSDIVIKDKNFPSVVNMLTWGRGIYDSVQVYSQFLLTASFVALVIDFVLAISPSKPASIDAVTVVSSGKIPYPAFQLMWVKLIMGTFAALALVIKHPPEDLMRKPPKARREPLITEVMWRNIRAQTLYQIAILLTIHFKGKSIFKVDVNIKDTMILNTYVLCQVFAIFNARSLEKNVFEEMQKKKLFWGITGIIIVIQVLMVEVMKRFADTGRLSWGQWGTCISIAAASWLITWLLPYLSNPKLLILKSKVE